MDVVVISFKRFFWIIVLLVSQEILARSSTYNGYQSFSIPGGTGSGGVYQGYPKSGYLKQEAGIYSGYPGASAQRSVEPPASDPVPYRETKGALSSEPLIRSHSFQASDNIQEPPLPYVYVLGRDVAKDFASNSRVSVGDGIPDVWLRLNARNLAWHLGKPGGYYTSGYGVIAFVLKTKGFPYRQWDTISNSRYPLIHVFYGTEKINHPDGTITGFLPPGDGKNVVDLFIGDDGLIASRHIPLEFQIITLDGTYTMGVGITNLWDYRID